MTSKIDRYFFVVAIIFAITGIMMGIHMGMTGDFTLHSMHAHINLLGWTSMALFGIGYRLGFAAKNKLAVVHFFLSLLGALILPVGVYFAIMQGREDIVGLGSLITLAAMVLFLWNVLRQRD